MLRLSIRRIASFHRIGRYSEKTNKPKDHSWPNLILTACINIMRPCDLDLWPFDLISSPWVTRDMNHLIINFGLYRTFRYCFRVRHETNKLTDRQTDRHINEVQSIMGSPTGRPIQWRRRSGSRGSDRQPWPTTLMGFSNPVNFIWERGSHWAPVNNAFWKCI